MCLIVYRAHSYIFLHVTWMWSWVRTCILSSTGIGTEKEINIIQTYFQAFASGVCKLWAAGQIHLACKLWMVLPFKEYGRGPWGLHSLTPYRKTVTTPDLHSALQLNIALWNISCARLPVHDEWAHVPFFLLWFTVLFIHMLSYILSVIEIIFPHKREKGQGDV